MCPVCTGMKMPTLLHSVCYDAQCMFTICDQRSSMHMVEMLVLERGTYVF